VYFVGASRVKSKKLLLINSSQVLMKITARILEREGYTVRCAVGRADATEQLMDFMPDAIILNDDLPDIDGLDYCRELHENYDIPIMFLSGLRDDKLPALQAGANDFIKRPFDFEILKSRINSMLNAVPDNRTAPCDDDSALPHTTVSAEPEKEYCPAAAPETPVSEPGAGYHKGTSLAKRLYIAAAACVVIVIVLAAVIINPSAFNISKHNDNPDTIALTEEPVPMAEFAPPVIDKNAKHFVGDNGYITIQYIHDITIPAETKNVPVFLFNPECNSCNLSFEIVLKAGSETIYSTDLLEPGMCVNEIALSRGLKAGEYDAILKIHAYTADGLEPVDNIAMDITITAT